MDALSRGVGALLEIAETVKASTTGTTRPESEVPAAGGPGRTKAAPWEPFGNLKWSRGISEAGKYAPMWSKDQREDAQEAARAFTALLEKEFRHGAGRSVKFVFQRTFSDGVEMAYRLRDLSRRGLGSSRIQESGSRRR